MSIRPQYARAIINGSKTVEFRKHPLADDVTHVVIYSTVPDRAVIGVFSIAGQETLPPSELWDSFAKCGGIDEKSFFEYYAEHESGTGIRVDQVHKLACTLDLAADLGVTRPPQSFQYLPRSAFQKVLHAVSAKVVAVA
jgi:predicted transcriptional regulator